MADETAIDDLNTRQHNAIAALLVEPTIRKAATAAGVPERTLYGWLKEPGFSAQYREARREAVAQSIARLQTYSSEAATTLYTVMKNTKASPAVRLMAARSVLEFAIKAVELEDIQARLEALEQAHAQH